DLVALVAQRGRDGVDDRRLVVDDQDSLSGAVRSSGQGPRRHDPEGRERRGRARGVRGGHAALRWKPRDRVSHPASRGRQRRERRLTATSRGPRFRSAPTRRSYPLGMKRHTVAGTIAVLALVFAAPATGVSEGAPGCPSNLANQLASTGAARQLVTVVTQERFSTNGRLRLWQKVGSCWQPVAEPWSAWVGGRGVSATKREGDRTTPAGAFGFGRVMYGVRPNPGVRFLYRRVVCGDWWVEDPHSPLYNRFHHVPCGTQPPFRSTSEDLPRSPTAYRHLAVIAYNMKPVVPGKG